MEISRISLTKFANCQNLSKSAQRVSLTSKPDEVSFRGGFSKSKMNGLDWLCIEKFKAPINSFKNEKDFNE